ncbi:MAG: hypothetical protein UT50_C0012G0009 [Candidatus Moranbacteria bacterium GW2011_GWA2_39_41]|nr:MAG: hypothetical protein UT50_C0012G0009 [Candidatus Moranbacteria bacterium GW2011_GWA2_39_41]
MDDPIKFLLDNVISVLALAEFMAITELAVNLRRKKTEAIKYANTIEQQKKEISTLGVEVQRLKNLI